MRNECLDDGHEEWCSAGPLHGSNLGTKGGDLGELALLSGDSEVYLATGNGILKNCVDRYTAVLGGLTHLTDDT